MKGEEKSSAADFVSLLRWVDSWEILSIWIDLAIYPPFYLIPLYIRMD